MLRGWFVVVIAGTLAQAAPSTDAEIARLGAEWRAKPGNVAPLVQLVALARKDAAWRAAVPFLVESLAKTDVVSDAVFEAIAALADQDVTVAMLTSLEAAKFSEKTRAAEDRAARALAPAYLAVAKLVAQPAARVHALDRLGTWQVPEVRPLALAALKEEPYTARNAGGGMSDPRGFLHLDAIEALAGLPPDAASADALFAYAFDPRMTDDAHLALEAFPAVTPAPTAAQLATLLDHALHPKQYQDAALCGHAYALLATTPAQLDKLAAAPAPYPPYFFGYENLIVEGKRALACEAKTPCLAALLETAVARQPQSFMIASAARALARNPDPAGRVAVVALADEDDEHRGFDGSLEQLIPGACPACVAHLEATVKRNASEPHWRYPKFAPGLLAELRARLPAGTTLPAPISPLDSFAAVAAAEHRQLASATPGAVDKMLFAPTAFGFGVDASEAGVGADTLAAFAAKDLVKQPAYEGIVMMRRGVRGAAMWDTEMVIYNNVSYALMSQLVVEDHGTYRVRAWSWAHDVRDDQAVAAAKQHELPVPAPIADLHGDAELEAFARRAFGSRDAFVAALSSRDDAFSRGNSISDEWPGAAAKKAFTSMGGSIAIHDGLHVEKVTADVGFAAANITFTSTTTSVFRVLAIFVKLPAGWTIVQSHWSYGLPIPSVH